MSVELSEVSFRYDAGERNAVDKLDVSIAPGEFVVFAGLSGCGKTTITRLINGLIPHFHEGELTGEVRVNGEDPSKQATWVTAAQVASVFQNPRSQFFTTDPRSEIAFGSENLGVPVEMTRKRVSEALRLFDLDDLADQSIFALSGGEKQRIACAAAHASHPDVYVLDEPSANLDVSATQALKRSMERWKAAGATVIVAEHRLGYLRTLVDRLILVDDGRVIGDFPAESITDDLLRHHDLRYQEGAVTVPQAPMVNDGPLAISDLHFAYSRRIVPGAVAQQQNLALDIDQLHFPQGKITAVIGDNGAGKSTLARWMAGLIRVSGATFTLNGRSLSRRQRRREVFLVLQDVNHQLVTESVTDEVAVSVALSGFVGERGQRAQSLIERMDLSADQNKHPMALSGGQQQRLAVATALASDRPVIILDEPTSGLDLAHMREVAGALKALTEAGRTVIVITHDGELVDACADHVVRMEHGRVHSS